MSHCPAKDKLAGAIDGVTVLMAQPGSCCCWEAGAKPSALWGTVALSVSEDGVDRFQQGTQQEFPLE